MTFGAAGIGGALPSPFEGFLDEGAGRAGTAGRAGGAAGGAAAAGGTAGTQGFGDILRGKLGELSETQAVADTAARDLATNRVEDVAQAMLRVEQANVSLQLATQVRNKAIEAYQEILRMQI